MGLISKCQECGALLDFGGKCIRDPSHRNKMFTPKSENEKNMDKCDKYVELGFYHLERENAVDALTQFESALSLNPNNYKAWFGKAKALLWLNEFESSLEYINKAISISPDSLKALKLKRKIHEHLEDNEEIENINNKIKIIKARKDALEDNIKLRANLAAILYLTKNLSDIRKKKGKYQCYHWEAFRKECVPVNTKRLNSWLSANWEGENLKSQIQKLGIYIGIGHSSEKKELISLDINDQGLFDFVWNYFQNEVNEVYGSMEKFVEGMGTIEYIGKDAVISKRLFAYFCKPHEIEINKTFLKELEKKVQDNRDTTIKYEELIKRIDYTGYGIYNLISSLNYYFLHREIKLKACKAEYRPDVIRFKSIQEGEVEDFSFEHSILFRNILSNLDNYKDK